MWFASLQLGKCQNITGTLTQVTRITFLVLCSCSLTLETEKAVKYSKNKHMKQIEIRDSVVGIATGYEQGSEFESGRVKNFLFSTSSRPALGSTQPPIQWVPGTLSPGLKRPGREADHSPRASAEIKKIWTYTSSPPYAFIV
jgi:hypothetical protein